MRTFFFVILGCTLLTSSTELHQLFKLPFLLAHYRHHRQEDKSQNLFDFLRIHYSENHPPDNDDDEDNQLPFKSAGNICHLDTLPATIKDISVNNVMPISGKMNFVYQDEIPSRKSFSIFHPPRFS